MGTFPLAQQVPVPTGSFAAFGQWSLLGALVTGVGALCKLGYTVYKNEHRDLDAAKLTLKQAASNYFANLVLQESRRVFTTIDDLIPQALSQAASGTAESRFDHFCKSLRLLGAKEQSSPSPAIDDELAEARGAMSVRDKYSDIIKESFGRIISDTASRLLDAMSTTNLSTSSTILNPTGARFPLQEESYLSFARIASFEFQTRKLLARFRFFWASSGVFAAAGVLAGIPIILGFLVNASWAQTAAWWGLVSGCACGGLAVITVCASYWVKQVIIRRAERVDTADLMVEVMNKQRAADGNKSY